MNFLAPLFLLGALAVAGPVIFHLIRRTTRDRQRFGSLMFLEPTPPRLTKKSRIEHWLLLLLRAAALALLALAFSRPFFRTPASPAGEGTGANRTVVLLDTSASLRRTGMWDTAKARAVREVERAASGGSVALVAFDRSVTPLFSFEDWERVSADSRAGMAAGRTSAGSPSWAGTDAAGALTAAAEMLAESGGKTSGTKTIVLVTDAQEGSRLEALQGYEWPAEVRLRIEVIKPNQGGNAGLQLAAEAKSGKTATATTGVRLRVVNSPDASGESFQVGWVNAQGDYQGKAVDAYVPPGQSRIVLLPWPEGGPATGRVRLRGDAEEFDNYVTVTPPPAVTLPVIYSGIEGDPRGPLAFLRKALPAGRTLTATVDRRDRDAIPPPEVLKIAPLWVTTEPLSAPVAAAASSWVNDGGTLLLVLQNQDMAETLRTVAGAGPASLAAMKRPARGAMLGTIDFGHPLFSAFAEPRFSDFTKIRFWEYCPLDIAALPGAVVAAKFDSGDPAVVEVAKGRGRVFLLTAGWHPAASQLALSSKFPSLLGSLLLTTGAGAPVAPQFTAGESAAVVALIPAGVDKATITAPGGQSQEVTRGATWNGFAEPGLYRATWDGGQRELAVNPDASESRTAALPVEEFEKLGLPVTTAEKPAAGTSTPAPDSLAAAAETEGRQKIWRWLLAAVLAVLFIETLLGIRAARHYSVPEGGSAV